MRPDESMGRPDGVPVGRALEIPAGIVHDDLRAALAIISRVHGDGDLPPIPMRVTRLPLSRDGTRVRRGQFAVNPQTGQPIAILIEAQEQHRVLTATHEIGHFLDLCGIGEFGRFASPDDAELEDWRRALVRSRAIHHLTELGRDKSEFIDRAHVAELLDPVEAWARSYAQYVARRSGDERLRAGIDAFRTRLSTGVYYPYQWEESDFDAIDATIEGLFRRLGWRSAQQS